MSTILNRMSIQSSEGGTTEDLIFVTPLLVFDYHKSQMQ
uniref:Uncharacterized protein n=1 Tax=Arundo donax TaxID=35708 RepID=A0A0A8ZU02_ARUDO